MRCAERGPLTRPPLGHGRLAAQATVHWSGAARREETVMKTPSGNAVRRLTSAGGLRRARQADASRSTRDRTLLSRRSTGRMKREDTEKRLRELELFCGLWLFPAVCNLLHVLFSHFLPLHLPI